MIANDVSDPGIGFGSDDNQVLVVASRGTRRPPRLPKAQLARLLIEQVAQALAGDYTNLPPEPGQLA